MLRASTKSTTWFSRMLSLVSVMRNTSPTPRIRCPGSALTRLSLPSHSGCCEGSAISSKIRSAVAAISRVALTTRGSRRRRPVRDPRSTPPIGAQGRPASVARSRSSTGIGRSARRVTGTTPAQCGNRCPPASSTGPPVRTLADTSTRSRASTAVAASSRAFGARLSMACRARCGRAAREARDFLSGSLDQACVADRDHRPEFQRMVHRRAGQDQPVDQGGCDANGQAVRRSRGAASGRCPVDPCR